MTAGYLLQWTGPLTVPGEPPADLAVAPNFERFDGLSQPPLENPAGSPPLQGSPNRPGFLPTPDEYTPGPLSGVVGVTGGQPLPVGNCIHRPPGDYTGAVAPSIQFRQGIGQRGPSELGTAQTATLSELTRIPPVPDDLLSILGAYG